MNSEAVKEIKKERQLFVCSKIFLYVCDIENN